MSSEEDEEDEEGEETEQVIIQSSPSSNLISICVTEEQNLLFFTLFQLRFFRYTFLDSVPKL